VLELKLPELGEDVETVDVAAVLVSVGDTIQHDQPVIEVETEKASLEVPSTLDGRVTELLVTKGDKIRVGQVILRAEAAPADAQVEEPAAAPAPEPADRPSPTAPAPAAAASSTPRETAAAAAAGGSPPSEVIAFPAATPRARPEIGPSVPAAPSARALARQIGVEIHQVRGTGPGGRISREDVKAHAKRIIQGRAAAGPAAAPELPDFARWGEVRREPLSAVRRATASHMATAWSAVPHVTQHDRADVTQLESMRKRFNARPEAERKLTMTAIVIKIAAAALDLFPNFNASLDLERDEVILKSYVHIGVAVDTGRGLLVPVIRDVDRKSLVQVAAELGDLAARARDKKLKPDEMHGAGFTVSNLGGLGTTYFSPIVNWPEVAILGVGRAEQQAVSVHGHFEPRLILPLSLSYDHRLIDGADTARFLRWVAEALEQPLTLLLDE
jgi:pyruvate dehydrogenase E2 component (dihydrolipoamide acetyltransferase)